MGDLLEFLQGIQLEHLAEIFQREEISLSILLKMTDDELQTIGINKFGNRKAIQNAVQNFKEFKDKEVVGDDCVYHEVEDNDCFKYSSAGYQSSEYEELWYATADELTTEKVEVPLGEQSRNSVVQCRAEEIQALFFGKPDCVYNARQSGTAFEQVAALLGSVSTKKKKAKAHFENIYDKLLSLMGTEEIFPQLREELKEEYGDVNKYLREGIEDLHDDSCPIVVTGETSAGKSSFVNLLLGVDILPQSTLSCTAAICRIHNKEEKKVVLIYKSGKQTDLNVKQEIEAPDMKKHLKKYVSVQCNQEATRQAMDGDILLYVDIWWPIKNIPKEILIVDTPGVGPDNPFLTDRLYEYLPKALAFIYVLNSPNAGGVQKDRILQVQEELAKHRNAEDTYFDTSRAIFICNKWDQIDVDEEEPDEVFNAIQQKLTEGWSGFDPKKLFKLSAREEIKKCKAGETISKEFKAVLGGIIEMIPATVEEKLKRHVKKQQSFIESIQKKVTARISATMKSKEENSTMITKIKKKIASIENSIQVNKLAVTHKAKQEREEIAKRLHDQINDPATKAKMFHWSNRDLPDGSDFEQIQAEIDDIVKASVASEIRERIQNDETKRLEKFVEQLFRDECYTIAKEVGEMEGFIFGDYYGYADTFNTVGEDSGDSYFTLQTRQKVFLAVTSPVLVPTALAVGVVLGLLLLPVGAGYVIKDKVKNIRKVNKYKQDKPALAKKRAEQFLETITLKTLEEKMEDCLKNEILDKINNFFCDVIPKRLQSAKALVTNIESDLREPADIRKDSHMVEGLIRPIYGQVLSAAMKIFGEKVIKTSDISNVHQKGNMVIARLNIKKSNPLSVVKKVSFGGKGEAGWKYLAEITAFRRCRHQNLLQVYGVCVPETCDIRDQFYIISETYEKDLTIDVLQHRLNWAGLTGYLRDALEGLSYLHLSGLVHRNIQLESILIKSGEVKLAEIGDDSCDPTPTMRTPESFRWDYYGYETDIFQFGIVMWECWYHKRAYGDCKTRDDDVSSHVMSGEQPKITYPFPSKLENCLKLCWHNNPDKRPSAKNIQSIITTSRYITTV